MPAGVLHNLLVDGIIAGAGGVLVFLPQIVIPFSLHPGAGRPIPAARRVPARSADARRRPVGRVCSFLLLSSFACAVPRVSWPRTVQDPKERLITIMIALLMTCLARLPVYAVIIAAFIPGRKPFSRLLQPVAGLVLFALYAAGASPRRDHCLITRRNGAADTFPLLLELLSQLPLARSAGNLLRGLWSASDLPGAARRHHHSGAIDSAVVPRQLSCSP